MECLVRKRPRELVQIMDHIRARLRIEIDADRVRNPDHAAADVEGGRELSHASGGATGGLAPRRYSRKTRSLRNGVLAQTFFHSRKRSSGVVRVNGWLVGTYQLLDPVRLTRR